MTETSSEPLLLLGDCLDRLREMPDNSVDSVVTDPPYGLSFMGKKWDYDVPSEEIWRECLRVLKPGGHLLAFAGTRTQHRMAVRIEDAGFEIRDMIAWVYSTGFPKSHNFGCKCSRDALPYSHEKAIQSEQATECKMHPLRDSNVSPSLDIGEGRGEVLQPCLSQSGASIEGREQLSTSKVRGGESSMEGRRDLLAETRELQADQVCPVSGGVSAYGSEGRLHNGASSDNGADNGALPIEDRSRASCKPRPAGQPTGESGVIPKQRGAQERGVEADQVCAKCGKLTKWQGFGTALKPSHEPITVARKPLGEKTVAANVLAHGTGGINVDGCRVSAEGESFDHLKGRPLMKINNRRTDDESLNGAAQQAALAKLKDLGRWPANLIHDGSDEVVGLFPVVHGAGKARAASEGTHRGFHEGVTNFSGAPAMRFGDSGSAARFFKCCPPETLDLLFCRAKSILSAWKIKNVSHAESSLPQQKQAVASVLSDAVILVSQGDKRLSDVRGLSTTVTASEFEKLCETLITAMLILESGALPDLLPDAPIQNGCLVNVAVIQKPTDTTTITINLPTSGGYADPVTFSITPQNLDHGAKDLSADRFKYCAKASKKDRDEGCKGLETQNNMRVNGPRESEEAKHATKRSNFHPTVKPTALMRYLCRLVTPPGGIVLDPFMGSGSTGKAAMLDGFQFIGIERDEEYMEIAKARIGAASNEHA